MGKVTLQCININPLDGNVVAPPLEEGKMYINTERFKCDTDCGEVHYLVGIEKEDGTVETLASKFNYIRCHKCKKELPNSGQGGKHWSHPTRFVSLVTEN